MHIDAKPIDLKLTVPFRISRGVQHISPNVIVQINHDELTGYGEASPAEYYGESRRDLLSTIRPSGNRRHREQGAGNHGH